MATELSTVYDIFMSLVDDYRLVAMYAADVENSTTNLDDYLRKFLDLAIFEFEDYCNQSLGITNDSFDVELTEKNQKILARLMVKYWLKRLVDDVVQMNWNLQDHDFKHYSEAQNLREKSERYNAVSEECSQILIDYAYRGNDWDSWFTGNFAGN